ncbi:oleate hydratase [Staphylococcus agnetis]|uniref:Oleate hydratase n=1 Tax=Staphylococcus agnetis TaxID=985762 RepID=A0ABX3Z0R0_9STAP|nr:oleate hydratase [Staphylococcus agnetis]ALN77580.1 oleate hydratase [Staphylococcus agnetis]OSP19095.1 oleate hydratase [Staphylococcus agnetis]OSP24286.1 oleate hydratase [Staphylococcus agnetis]OTW30028.1 oleate hydratase [Staphylococcus agnetis]
MYYSKGNYEAFARPKKPENVEKKSAYLVGSGLASLAAACFLIRDGQMEGTQIHILEEMSKPGGSLDGDYLPVKGYVVRGGREMENHFECLWDLFRSIPSLEVKGASVLDEFYWLNKEDPNYSRCRVIEKRGQRLATDGDFTLTPTALKEIVKLCLTNEADLDDVSITEVFSKGFFDSNFWIYWKTMFAFEPWHSAMEMRRYLLRFIHHINGLADFSSLKFTKYNQYESLVMPMIHYLRAHQVQFDYNVEVEDIKVDVTTSQKVARELLIKRDGQRETLKLTPDDLVFVTNGSITESSTYGDNFTPAPPSHELGGSWKLWQNLAKQSPEFGNPEKFSKNIPPKSWFVSATATTNHEKVIRQIETLCKRDPLAGKTVTGGIITVHDSSWQLSFTVNRQQQFKSQPEDQVSTWIYALYSDVKGDYIKKPITECSGHEICQEWLYHMGMPEDQIEQLAKDEINTIPVYMPYITAYFMPRALGDRPRVVPHQSRNLAFIGNFAETERDTVFTTEYSVRTAMEAVYQLLNIDRGVPETIGTEFDVRELMKAMYHLNDRKGLSEITKTNKVQRTLFKGIKRKIKGTYIETLLKTYHLL